MTNQINPYAAVRPIRFSRKDAKVAKAAAFSITLLCAFVPLRENYFPGLRTPVFRLCERRGLGYSAQPV
jgi:hypothetical protein